MRTEFNARLNGEDFAALDPRLYIQDIQEQVKYSVQTGNRPHYGKVPLGRPGREELQIIIKFMIKDRDRAHRQNLISIVNGWATSGWLSISTRPYQRIYAYCTQPASCESLVWSAEMSIVFSAYGEARFVDTNKVSADVTGASGSAILRPLGTAPCHLEADIHNTSGAAVSSVSLTVNGKTLAFTGLDLASGKTLKLYCDERDVLQATIDGAGKMNCRTPESADELRLNPRADNAITFTASRSCSVKLYARGRYD